MQIYSIE